MIDICTTCGIATPCDCDDKDGIILLDEFEDPFQSSVPGKRYYLVQGTITYEDEVMVLASSEEEARHIGGCELSGLQSYTTDVRVTKVYLPNS